MSTDWGIGCRTCAAAGVVREGHFTGEWDNCRDIDALRKLIDARSHVVATSDALGGLVRFSWSEWATGDANGIVQFFRDHINHDLAPMNEYGQFDDDCGKRVDCPTCGTSHRCRRRREHDGACSARPEAT